MFETRLREINDRLEGSRLAAVVGRDGLVVQSAGELTGADTEALAAELTSQLGSLASGQRELGGGDVEELSVTTGRHIVLVGSLSDDYYMMLVLDRGGAQGRARFELRRARLRLGPDLA